MKIINSNKSGSIISVIFFIVAAIGCACPPPNQNSDRPSNSQTMQSFTYAVVVRDREKNRSVGQINVSIIVGNEIVEVKPTDENGQARFSIDGKYLGKDARIYASSSKYHPKDEIVKLKTDETKILQIVSTDYPITVETPTPPPANTSKQNTTVVPKPTSNIPTETISLNQTKTGIISDKQKLDFRFEGSENMALLFKIASVEATQSYHFEYAVYDAEGFFQKGGEIGRNSQKEMPFTPLRNGTYTLRLVGTNHYGNYTISMQPIR